MNNYKITIVDQFKEEQVVNLSANDVIDAVHKVQTALQQGLNFGKLYDIVSIEKMEG